MPIDNFIMKIVLPFLFVFVSFTMFSQNSSKPYNQFSMEAEYGTSIPMIIVSEVSDESFIANYHFGAGIRYMFNQDWGVKGSIMFDQFKESAELGTNFIRLDAQAHYNLGKKLNIVFTTDEFMGLYVHSGFGVSFAESLYNGSREHNGNFILGVSPLFRLSDHFSLSTDISYILNIKQHFYFDGIPFDPATVKFEHGAQVTFSFGLIYYIGKKDKVHADWY